MGRPLIGRRVPRVAKIKRKGGGEGELEHWTAKRETIG